MSSWHRPAGHISGHAAADKLRRSPLSRTDPCLRQRASGRLNLRRVLDETSLQQVRTGKLPAHVKRMADAPDAWLPR